MPPSSLMSPSSRNGLSKTNGRWPQPFIPILRSSMQDAAELWVATSRVVSRHLRSDLYLGHIFLSNIQHLLLLSHGNLPRSKVVENIAMADYTPISMLEITPCHSKSDG